MPPPHISPLLLSSSLKLTQLRKVATSLGINVSSTKAVLADDICHTLISPSRLPHYPTTANPTDTTSSNASSSIPSSEKPTRILSIDMGIRNLAICLLSIPPVQDLGDSTRIKPTILSWQRIAISPSAIIDAQSKSSPSSRATKFPIPFITIPGMDTNAAESFTPETISKVTYKLCQHLLETHEPDQVLIEKQRFRSMGGKAVNEWTIRINMFESILWGSLYTLYREGKWPKQLQGGNRKSIKTTNNNNNMQFEPVHSIDPKKVLYYWEQWHDTGTAIPTIPIIPGAYADTPRLNKPSDATKTYHDAKVSKTAIVTDFLYEPRLGDEEVVEVGSGKPEDQKPTPSLFEIGSEEARKAAKLFLPCFAFPRAVKGKGKVKGKEKEKESGLVKEEKVLEGEISLEEYDVVDEEQAEEESIYDTIPPQAKRTQPKGKLDDLADALLQGLAWVKWEEARLRIVGDSIGLGTVGVGMEPRVVGELPSVREVGPEDRVWMGMEGEEEEEGEGRPLFRDITLEKKRRTAKKKITRSRKVVEEVGGEEQEGGDDGVKDGKGKKRKSRRKSESTAAKTPKSIVVNDEDDVDEVLLQVAKWKRATKKK